MSLPQGVICVYPLASALQIGCGWICVHAGEGSIWSCMSCPLTPSSSGCCFPDLGLPGATCTVRYWECCLGDLEIRSPAWIWIWASFSSREGCTDLGCWVLGLGGKWCESPLSPLRSHFSEKCQCFREAASPPSLPVRSLYLDLR